MNPLMQALKSPQIEPQNLQTIKNTMQALNMAQNPSQALTEASQNNPAIRSVMELCKGRDPKAVFFEECEKRGISPEYIINLLR